MEKEKNIVCKQGYSEEQGRRRVSQLCRKSSPLEQGQALEWLNQAIETRYTCVEEQPFESLGGATAGRFAGLQSALQYVSVAGPPTLEVKSWTTSNAVGARHVPCSDGIVHTLGISHMLS